MDLIRQVLKVRQEMYKPKPVVKSSEETEGLTLATIIEDKPKRKEVIKYFRARADECDGS
jgi:hypothetical protein